MAERRLPPCLALMAASGFSGLGLQIVWTQQIGASLGHEAAGVLGVVTAFFGGMALGALALGSAIQRSTRPLRWYVAAEAVIALWSLLLILSVGPASGLLMALTGSEPTHAWQWTVAFVGTLLLLLPATAAMGATLPAMDRLLDANGTAGRAVAALYAANTLGAVAGVLAAAFWLVPTWGLAATAGLCAVLNLGCAAAAWWALGTGANLMNTADTPSTAAAPAASTASTRKLVLTLAATGFLGIGYEVLVVRALSQVAENTVYTFAILLAVYLLGTAVGAAVLHRVLGPRSPSDAWRNGLLQLLALSCLLGMATLWALSFLQAWLLQHLGEGMPAAVFAEAVLALAAFGLPTLVMGALFSVLARQAAAAGLGLGRALSFNTLGAAAAPLLLGVLLLPLLGLKLVLVVVALGYLTLCSRRAFQSAPAWCLLIAGGALALVAPPLVTVDVPAGGSLVSHVEGVLATVSVVEDGDGVQRLHIDNRQQEGSNATALADGRQALLPLLLHAAPSRALFLGLGTGVTAATASSDQDLSVLAVELLPEVVQAAAFFTPALGPGAAPSRLTVQVADARRFVRSSGPLYDLVVSDNFHPARSGSAALYTVEHFAAVKARLATGGLFCQWLPLHQMDLATLRSIVHSFLAVYPQGMAMLATNSLDTPVVGLVARQDGRPVLMSDVRQRLRSARLTIPSAEYGFFDEWAVLGSLVAGPRALQAWSDGAPLNTDDHPVVAYLAPRITYAPTSLPRDRLLQWLEQLPGDARDAVDTGDDTETAKRLQAYWSARQRFLLAGRDVRPSNDARRMLQQVQGPLLDVLRTSPDFQPAYDPLVALAQGLARSDPNAAAALFHQLQRIAPARPQAGQALAALPLAPGR